MKLTNIDPFIRFAGEFNYISKGSDRLIPDCRLHYIISGEGEIIIKNQHYKLIADTAFFCHSGFCYNIVSETGLNIIALNFDLNKENSHIKNTLPTPLLKEKGSFTPIGGDIIEDGATIAEYNLFYGASFIKEYFLKILCEYEKNTEVSHCAAETLLKFTLLSLDCEYETMALKSNAALKRAIEYIDENFKSDIDNKFLASLCGYHEYYFGKIFLKYTGMTPHKYIINKRLNESKKLLLGTNETLDSIAHYLGFSAGTHFSSCFKKEFGISPTEYKNKQKTNI